MIGTSRPFRPSELPNCRIAESPRRAFCRTVGSRGESARFGAIRTTLPAAGNAAPAAGSAAPARRSRAPAQRRGAATRAVGPRSEMLSTKRSYCARVCVVRGPLAQGLTRPTVSRRAFRLLGPSLQFFPASNRHPHMIEVTPAEAISLPPAERPE